MRERVIQQVAHWVLPGHGKFKLNIDGVDFSEEAQSSLKVVIQDSHGDVLATISHIFFACYVSDLVEIILLVYGLH